jgi:hypothetical protein
VSGGQERGEYLRHQLLETDRSIERLLRTLVRQRIRKHVSQQIDARDEIVGPVT